LPLTGIGDPCQTMLFTGQVSSVISSMVPSNFTTLVFDFVTRQKVGGTHLTFFALKQLPVLPPDAYTEKDLLFIVPRVLELVYTEEPSSEPSLTHIMQCSTDSQTKNSYTSLTPMKFTEKTFPAKPSASSKKKN